MSVGLVHGVNIVHLPLSGHTVGRARTLLRDVLNLSKRASAFLRGQHVADDHLLATGDLVEFVRLDGHKGGHHDYWSEDELVDFFGSENVQKMRENGMALTSRAALTSEEVVSWNKWLQDTNHDPADTLNVRVSVEDELIVMNGKEYQIDMELAAIAKCIVDAKGEIRSQTYMKREYEGLLVGKLDRHIKERLKSHPSGIGKCIKGEKGKGYRLLRGPAAKHDGEERSD